MRIRGQLTAAALLAGTFSMLAVVTVRPVLAQVSPGVTQSAAHTANITGTVAESDGRPVVGAEVKLNGPAVLSTKSDGHGVFNFRSVPWGTYEIVVTSPLGTASRDNIVLSGDIDVAIQYQAQQPGLKTIAHVSTANAGAHINVTSSSISSVNPSEYAFQGNGTWTQLFAPVPGVAVSGEGIGGENPFEYAVGLPQAPVVLSINGALPYETSTTLDGMSLGNSVDLSYLPLAAFDTADVVRGPGANAPSIVDSVGGSFVLHGPGPVAANQLELSFSNDPFGGMVTNAKIALHLGRLSATLIYGVNYSPGPLGATEYIPAYTPGLLTINGQSVQGSVASIPTNAFGVANCYCVIRDSLLLGYVPQSSAWNEDSGAVDLAYSITPSITAEVFYAGARSDQPDSYGYYPVEFAPGPGYSGSLSPSLPGQANYRLLAGFGEQDDNVDASRLLEEKLTAYPGGGVLRLAALQSTTFNTNTYICSHGDGTYKLWGTADLGATSPGTPTTFNGTSANVAFLQEGYTYNTASNERDLLASYAVQIGSASSAGISYVKSYSDNPNALNFFAGGTVLFSSVQSSAVSQTVNETRLHFDTVVSDKLSLGLSWYFAQGSFHVPVPSNPNLWTNSVFPYSAPRFGAVWEASPNIAVRAALGGGYALPSLGQLIGYSLACAPTYCDENIANLNLKPEKTFGFDVGTDMRLHRDTVLSFDIYRTNLYGQFFSTTSLSSINGLPLYLTEIGNIGTSRMEGINLDIHHDAPSGYYWRGTLGFTRGYVVSVPSGFYNDPGVPCMNCTNQTVVPGINFQGVTYSATVPYASASAQVGYRWSRGRFFDLSSTYYGNNNIYLTPTAFIELDAHAGYAITRNISLLATFRNITGAYDQSVITYLPSYATPTIQGPTGYWQGASYPYPYGPRSVIMTANFSY